MIWDSASRFANGLLSTLIHQMACCEQLKYGIAVKALYIPYFCRLLFSVQYANFVCRVISLQYDNDYDIRLKTILRYCTPRFKTKTTWNSQCFHGYFMLGLFIESHLVKAHSNVAYWLLMYISVWHGDTFDFFYWKELFTHNYLCIFYHDYLCTILFIGFWFIYTNWLLFRLGSLLSCNCYTGGTRQKPSDESSWTVSY